MTLEETYNCRKKSYEGRPAWQWEDEGKYYAVADYYSMTGEFTEADRAFIEQEGLKQEVDTVLEDTEED